MSWFILGTRATFLGSFTPVLTPCMFTQSTGSIRSPLSATADTTPKEEAGLVVAEGDHSREDHVARREATSEINLGVSSTQISAHLANRCPIDVTRAVTTPPISDYKPSRDDSPPCITGQPIAPSASLIRSSGLENSDLRLITVPTRMLTTVVGSRSAPHSERKPAVPMSIEISKTICDSATNRMHTVIKKLFSSKTSASKSRYLREN
eukprot:PDM73626.1 hypothetical protein PRIPAC_40982 [Pristionchus pacificus]